MNALRRLKSHRSLARAYFEALYFNEEKAYRAHNPDYEDHREFAFSLLDDGRYLNGLEVGCGEGFMTHWIAARCERVLSTDISSVAVRRARKRNAHLTAVTFQQHNLVADPLPDDFDYIFCGEVLYYLRYDQLTLAVESLVGHLREGGVLHLLHHRSIRDDEDGLDTEIGAKTIHEMFIDRDDLRVEGDEICDQVRATVLRKPTSVSP